VQPRPIRLTDDQLSAIFTAAKPLAVEARDPFLRDVAALLAHCPEPGPGDVDRAIRAAQARHFRPPVTANGKGTPTPTWGRRSAVTV
jgi:hypothetical protein